MYGNSFASASPAKRVPVFAFAAIFAALAVGSAVRAADFENPSVIRKISERSEKLELTTNSSRILTLDKKVPRVQVNNPELLAVTPLSAKDIQISAKKAGVTQVNLWDEDGSIHTVDVMIYGDARELSNALQTQFPHSSIKVYRYSESLVLTGFVDRPDHVGPIMRLAEDYAPKVINNISVGGVQQILLKVKVMEISRTKLRRMSTDWVWLDSNGSFFSQGVGGILNQSSNGTGAFQTITDTAGKSLEFGVVGDNQAFFGFLDWVQQNNIGKILSEPNIVAVSGRPAQFNVGGEIPIVVPQSLGTASIEFKPFGTQVDFLPIVLGNGNIRLEIRPRVSEIDDTRSVIIQDFTIPALTVRQVDTAVEMKAGQTFALAGLVQERSETIKRGVPYLSDLPVVGLPFRRVQDDVNEIELLILVTPEFVDPIDAGEAPCGGPGFFTTSPSNRQLYCGGQMEVPTHCNPTQGLSACGGDDCGNGGCSSCNNGGAGVGGGCAQPDSMPMVTEGVSIPGGTGYDDGTEPTIVPDTSSPTSSGSQPADLPLPNNGVPGGATLPAEAAPPAGAPLTQPQQNGAPQTPPNGAGYAPMDGGQAQMPAANGYRTAARPYNPPHQPVFLRNPSRPNNPQPVAAPAAAAPGSNGLIGPVGYDNQ